LPSPAARLQLCLAEKSLQIKHLAAALKATREVLDARPGMSIARKSIAGLSIHRADDKKAGRAKIALKP
jgi:hypothetical protein